jgi:hypothetical protein
MILKYPAAAWAETASAYVTKNRVAARRRIIVFAAICSIPLWFMLSGREGRTAPAGHNQAGPESRTPTFRVALPEKIRLLPEGASAKGATPGFKFRGIKGWAWVPAQYVAEIPVMAKYKMNFLMNCYTSLWDLEVHDTWAGIPSGKANHWYKPLPQAKKHDFERIVRECQKHSIQFCFSMNPNLNSDRPFDYDDPKDLDELWEHYTWMQSLGVKWFNISLDDIAQRIDAAGQAKLVNAVFQRLRSRDPQAQMIFCPTWYAGPDGKAGESNPRLGTGDTPGVRYTKELAAKLDPDVYLFWTGPEECSLTITAEEAENYKRLSRHRLFIWDNYPVNDQNPTLHLGPLMGRGPRLAKVADGYISNPLSPQNEANRIPLLTIADYLWNPEAYDPVRSIGQALAHLGQTPEQRSALKDLVELYPGRLVDGSLDDGWNSLRNRFRMTLDHGSQSDAMDFIKNAEGVSRRLAEWFPNQFVLARRTLDSDIAGMRGEYAKKYPPR